MIQHLDTDFDVLQASIQEMTRILKPQGKIVLSPLNMFAPDLEGESRVKTRATNQARILEWLTTQPNVSHRLERSLAATPEYGFAQNLIIHKKP